MKIKIENKIFNSDCLDILKKMSSCSVETIITDIPYALTATTRPRPDQNISGSYGKQVPFSRQQSRGGFMNMQWDSDIPSLKIFKELLRVTKYGGFFITTFTTRMDRQLQLYQRLKEAGWDITYSPLYWSYFTGFPKIANFSKLADKKLNVKRKIIGKRNDGRYKYEFSEKAKKALGSKNKDKQGMDGEMGLLTKPKSSQAKKLDGWYNFALKPAVEIIVCVRKPSPEKSLIGNALKSIEDKKYAVGGMFVGGLNLSKTFKGCGTRIPYPDNIPESGWSKSGANGSRGYLKTDTFKIRKMDAEEIQKRVEYGRFPANLLLSDDFPEYIKKYFNLDKWTEQVVGDFIFCPKPSTREKNSNIECKEVLMGTGSNTYNKKCLKCGKWQRHHKGKWAEHHKKYTCTCEEPDWEEPKGNLHATTKPISLFCYLIALLTRENTIVLDPFMGSGTTIMGCRLMNRKYVGIEKEKSYFKIAKKRISGRIIRQKTLF